MHNPGTVLLTGTDVARLLTMSDCIEAVENAFRMYGRKQLPQPSVLGVHCEGGGFHIKTALFSEDGRNYFVAKTNANFPGNPGRFSLPTIQGIVLLFDAVNGMPLAIMDSMEITILRTAAATAVAAKYLARPDAKTLAICGCGAQAEAHLRALCTVLPVKQCVVFDIDNSRAEAFAAGVSLVGLDVTVADSAEQALAQADVCVTCTPSRKAFVRPEMVRPGMFIAAVGADNPEKQELDPELLRNSKVVADMLEQCASIGDLHHAIAAGVMTRDDVHAELGEVVAGLATGRETPDEVIIFDSTGTALQDAAAACRLYTKAISGEVVNRCCLSA